jgi:hypothetical protein
LEYLATSRIFSEVTKGMANINFLKRLSGVNARGSRIGRSSALRILPTSLTTWDGYSRDCTPTSSNRNKDVVDYQSMTIELLSPNKDLLLA